jgi:hypothetical protein
MSGRGSHRQTPEPEHLDAFPEYRDEIGADVGHGWVGIGIEYLDFLFSDLQKRIERETICTSSVTSMGPGILQMIIQYRA